MATVPTNHTNISDVLATLGELNSAELVRLVPVIMYLIFLSVTGAAGNAVVFHVYRTKYRPSNSKSFILCLCLIDLFSCVVAMPLEILTVLDQYTFDAVWLCKTSRFSNYFTAMSSSWLIGIIAIERYRKVCRPFKWQISTKAGVYLCIFCIFCGVLSSVPAIFIFGKKSYIVPNYNITGTECSTDDSMETSALPTFHVFLSGGLFATDVFLIVILYIIIANSILRHEQTMPKHFRFKKEDSPGPVSYGPGADLDSIVPSRRPSEGDTLDNTHETPASTLNGRYKKAATSAVAKCTGRLSKCNRNTTSLPPKQICVLTDGTTHKTSIYPDLQNEVVKEPNYPTLQSNSRSNSQVLNAGEVPRQDKSKSLVNGVIVSRQSSTRKTALLMFMVSVAFVLSYTPHLILMFCRLIDEQFVDNLSDGGSAVYKFFLRSYFVNYAINPVIYCLCGTKFRHHCKEFICSRCNRTGE